MADIKSISARSLRREPVEERLSPGEAVRFSKRGGKKFELRRVDSGRPDINRELDKILADIPTPKNEPAARHLTRVFLEDRE